MLDNVEVEGRRKYIDYCTFQAFDVAKDAELMTDKGEYTYMVSDYLKDKGYTLTNWDGISYEQYLSEASEEGPTSSAMRSRYIGWLIEQSTINDFRTLWYVKEGTNNNTTPSFHPGFDIDIADVKSIIVYDSPHSYVANEELLKQFGMELILSVQTPKPPFPSGMYVVEIILHPGRKKRVAWHENARQTTFDGYSPKMEFYASDAALIDEFKEYVYETLVTQNQSGLENAKCGSIYYLMRQGSLVEQEDTVTQTIED